tara:strand:- start:6 stop:323 length:318 start_codon:yes stop_codon:yes gene_type:complete
MVLTNRQKFNKKYGFDKDASHSKKQISKLTGVSMSILNEVADRAGGAYVNNPSSVRNVKGVKGGAGKKMSMNAWKFGRIYSFVMGGTTQKTTDKDLWKKHLKSKK